MACISRGVSLDMLVQQPSLYVITNSNSPRRLDEEFGAKPKTVYTYKELIELLEATIKLHRNRTALRLLRKAGVERLVLGLDGFAHGAGAQPVRMKCQRRSPSRGRKTSDWICGAKRRRRVVRCSPRAASSRASAASVPAFEM